MDGFLQRAIQYLHESVRPKAEEIDQSVDALREALDGLCERQLMAMKRPVAYGGPAMSEPDFRHFQEEVARASGSLAFLQTQHQSATSMLAKSDNEALKAEYLPKMADGQRLVGIGFSQLRRPGEPIMRATPVQNGFILNGQVPWITGWSLFPEFMVGATLPSGEAVFAIVPFTEVVGIEFSEPMKLAAMETAMTVSGTFRNWLVSEGQVVFIKPVDWIKNNDMINIALQGHFAIGCAWAGLDVLGAAADRRGLGFLKDAHTSLTTELEDCRATTEEAQRGVEESTTEARLSVRAWAIDLAVRCAHAAVTASSGAANSLRHPAQRIYREALVYTVSAQTTPIMEATLARLTRQ